MIWAPFLQPVTANRGTQTFVQMWVTPAGGRYDQRVIIIVRPNLSQAAVAWCCVGARVSVAFGKDADAGRLRITPAKPGTPGAWTLGAPLAPPPQSKGGGVVRLILPGVPNLPAAGLPATDLAFKLEPDRLLLTLPPALQRDPSRGPSIDPVPKLPFKGIAASTGLGNGVGRPNRALMR